MLMEKKVSALEAEAFESNDITSDVKKNGIGTIIL
jgi:hypothetical protein